MLIKYLILSFSCVAISAAASLNNDFLEKSDLNFRDSFKIGNLLEFRSNGTGRPSMPTPGQNTKFVHIDVLESRLAKFFNDGDIENDIVTVPPIKPKENFVELDPPIIDTNDTFPLFNSKQAACTCGNRNVNGVRIVGGTQTKNGEIPWRAMVFVFNPSTGSGFTCGGTIISPNWIMTAAHCTMDFKRGYKINVYVGAQANPVSVGGGTKIEGDRYIQYPSFNGQTLDNDITLVHLKTPLTYKSNVSPACLPFGSLAKSDFKGTTVLASGWGTTKPVPVNKDNKDPSSRTLLQVSLPVITTTECRAFKNMAPTVNQFCTYKLGYDACQGDSGGSIDYQGPNGKYYAIGIVSWGYGCAQKDSPGVYTKVNNYLSWIQTNTKETFCQL